MTPTELNVLRAQMAANIYPYSCEVEPHRPECHALACAQDIIKYCGITADAPPPADPAKPEPDFETLLRNLVAEIDRGTPYPRLTNAYYAAVAAVAAVRP